MPVHSLKEHETGAFYQAGQNSKDNGYKKIIKKRKTDGGMLL
jgi:hypothetical protein